MGDLSLAKNLFIKLAIRCEFFIFFLIENCVASTLLASHSIRQLIRSF